MLDIVSTKSYKKHLKNITTYEKFSSRNENLSLIKKMTKNWSKIDQKLIKNWSKIDQKIVQKSSQKSCPKSDQKIDEKMTKKSSKNRSKIDQFFVTFFVTSSDEIFWDDFWSNFWSIFDQILINFWKVSESSWQKFRHDIFSCHVESFSTNVFVDIISMSSKVCLASNDFHEMKISRCCDEF